MKAVLFFGISLTDSEEMKKMSGIFLSHNRYVTAIPRLELLSLYVKDNDNVGILYDYNEYRENRMLRYLYIKESVQHINEFKSVSISRESELWGPQLSEALTRVGADLSRFQNPCHHIVISNFVNL